MGSPATADQPYEEIVSAMDDVAFVVDADLTIRFANRAALSYADLSLDELRGTPIAPLTERMAAEDEDPERFVDTARAVLAGETPEDGSMAQGPGGEETVSLEFELSLGDLGTVVADQRFTPTTFSDGSRGLVIISRDITDRKRNERELERTNAFLDGILDALPFPVYVIDTDDYRIYRDNSTDGEREGDTCYAVSHQRDVPCHEGEETFPCPLADVVRTGEATTVEHNHSDGDGGELIHEVHAAPLTDDDGSTEMMVESLIDVTERSEYERQLEEQRDNFETLNQVLRHDIRNDLQLVTAYADMLADRVDEEGQEHIETIRNNADHAIELTTVARDVADLWLSEHDETNPLSLKSTLEQEIERIREGNPAAAITVSGTIPEATVEATDMLHSVFHNILQNATKHNDKEVPAVTVSASDREDVVAVRFADNGPGIPDERKESIFGKDEKGLESSGTGLGLYLVKSLVDSYGGSVWVEDNDPDGAVFVVELPKASGDD